MGPQQSQPAQQPAPQMPPQPVAPMQPAPQGTPTTQPPIKRGLSKGVLWGIIGGGVGLLLLITGAILAVVFLSGPNKEDYSKASTTLSEVVEAYNGMGADYYDLTSTSSTDISRKNAMESMKNKQETFNTQFEAVGKMKGVAGDKDMKAKWDAVEDKRAKFNTYVNGLYEISEKVMPFIVDISDLSSPTSSELNSLIAKAENIKVSNDATNTYVAALVKYLKAYKDYAAYLAGDTYSSSAYSAYSAALNGYYDAAKDWSSSLEKAADEAGLKSELRALGDALSEKQFSK